MLSADAATSANLIQFRPHHDLNRGLSFDRLFGGRMRRLIRMLGIAWFPVGISQDYTVQLGAVIERTLFRRDAELIRQYISVGKKVLMSS
ncbi:MAG TPA: hypothetical protein VOA88_01255 [Candidatus Dormibacteraeota bacterium]|nr:hypothetical protein [Candidatus Dormibacteraeota bacterium]